jgi:hypothetical protein
MILPARELNRGSGTGAGRGVCVVPAFFGTLLAHMFSGLHHAHHRHHGHPVVRQDCAR